MENDEHCEAIYKKRGYYKDLYNACLVRQSVTVPQYRPHQFKRSLDTSKPVLICGDPGTGKTQFAIAQFKSPLVVSSSEEQDDPKASPLDILLKFDPNLHDAIVFDDLSFANRPFEFLKVLLDMDLDGPIRCSYNRTAIIPAGTPRVFTHNEKTIFDPSSKATEKQRCAIKRRYSVMEVSSPLFQLEAVSFIGRIGPCKFDCFFEGLTAVSGRTTNWTRSIRSPSRTYRRSHEVTLHPSGLKERA